MNKQANEALEQVKAQLKQSNEDWLTMKAKTSSELAEKEAKIQEMQIANSETERAHSEIMAKLKLKQTTASSKSSEMEKANQALEEQLDFANKQLLRLQSEQEETFNKQDSSAKTVETNLRKHISELENQVKDQQRVCRDLKQQLETENEGKVERDAELQIKSQELERSKYDLQDTRVDL